MSKSRARSKTHWAAAVLAALAIVEAQSDSITLLFGDRATAAVLLAAAVLMAVLRELTTQPISGSAAEAKAVRDRLYR